MEEASRAHNSGAENSTVMLADLESQHVQENIHPGSHVRPKMGPCFVVLLRFVVQIGLFLNWFSLIGSQCLLLDVCCSVSFYPLFSTVLLPRAHF